MARVDGRRTEGGLSRRLRKVDRAASLALRRGRLALKGTRVVGVEYLQDGAKAFVRAEREVILAGGAINSPQLLMLSGIGDPTSSRRTGSSEGPLDRCRAESAGSCRGAIVDARARAARSSSTCGSTAWPGHRGRLHLRHRLCDNLPGGADRLPQERSERADPRHPAPLHRRTAVRGLPLSAAVLGALCDGFGCRSVVLRPQCPADHAGIDRSARGAAHRAEPARHRARLEQASAQASVSPASSQLSPRSRPHQGRDRAWSGRDVGRRQSRRAISAPPR